MARVRVREVLEGVRGGSRVTWSATMMFPWLRVRIGTGVLGGGRPAMTADRGQS